MPMVKLYGEHDPAQPYAVQTVMLYRPRRTGHAITAVAMTLRAARRLP